VARPGRARRGNNKDACACGPRRRVGSEARAHPGRFAAVPHDPSASGGLWGIVTGRLVDSLAPPARRAAAVGYSRSEVAGAHPGRAGAARTHAAGSCVRGARATARFCGARAVEIIDPIQPIGAPVGVPGGAARPSRPGHPGRGPLVTSLSPFSRLHSMSPARGSTDPGLFWLARDAQSLRPVAARVPNAGRGRRPPSHLRPDRPTRAVLY